MIETRIPPVELKAWRDERAACIGKRFTQAEAAKFLKCGLHTYKCYEAGRRNCGGLKADKVREDIKRIRRRANT